MIGYVMDGDCATARTSISEAIDKRADALRVAAPCPLHPVRHLPEHPDAFETRHALDRGEFTIYHSGDCRPYEGIVDRLRLYNVTAALLPINGNGNFEIHEAAQLAEDIAAATRDLIGRVSSWRTRTEVSDQMSEVSDDW